MQKTYPHMVGFENEARLHEIFCLPQIRNKYEKWNDFIEAAQIINPSLCKNAFEPRSCKRTLRYIGYDHWDEETRLEMEKSPNNDFIYGHIYHSLEFNGAVYKIEENLKTIGMVYFEIIE